VDDRHCGYIRIFFSNLKEIFLNLARNYTYTCNNLSTMMQCIWRAPYFEGALLGRNSRSRLEREISRKKAHRFTQGNVSHRVSLDIMKGKALLSLPSAPRTWTKGSLGGRRGCIGPGPWGRRHSWSRSSERKQCLPLYPTT